MAITYDTTTGLRALLGGNLVSDIDTGFLSLAQDVAATLGHAMQEGVLDAGSFEVTQASGGASLTLDIASNVGTGAFVQNDSATGLPLVYLPPTVAKSTVTVTAAHATLPRVDSVYVTTAGVVTYVAGTATSGATLDNRTGAASIPSNALHLADLLVPATDTTIDNTQIRDRRRWARGFDALRTLSADTNTSSTTYTTISTDLQSRVECSGAPLRARLEGMMFTNPGGADRTCYLALFMDGSIVSPGVNHWQFVSQNTGIQSWPFSLGYIVTPSAGSHVFDWRYKVSNVAGTITFLGTVGSNTSMPLLATYEEIVRQNTKNNIQTSG
jgi:hypothetical protein